MHGGDCVDEQLGRVTGVVVDRVLNVITLGGSVSILIDIERFVSCKGIGLIENIAA